MTHRPTHHPRTQVLHLAAVMLPLLLSFLLPSCATQIAPTGGPPDTDPPVVVETDPPQGTTHFTGTHVRFTFDEYVDHSSFQQAVHVSPLQRTPPVFNWSGKSVEVAFGDPLLPDRTYVVSVGTDVKDVHAGNKLARTVNLAFSTGDSLDQGTFFGRVQDSDPTNVSIFAYLLDGRRADTLNPATLNPDYVCQTGKDGSFRFSNIIEGRYRVFAVRDNQKNFLYDIEADDIGMPQDSTIVVADTTHASSELRFRLVKEDTSAPYLQTLEAQTLRTLLLTFNEEIDPLPVVDSMFSIVDSMTAQRIPVLGMRRNGTKKFSHLAHLGRDLAPGPHLLIPRLLLDRHGNAMTRPHPFPVAAEADTLRPQLLGHTPARDQKEYPADSSLSLSFSMPMTRDFAVAVRDSAGREHPLRITWSTPYDAVLSHDALPAAGRYELRLDLRTCRDSLTGRTAGDSVFVTTFTVKERKDGSVSGTIVDSRDSVGGAVVELLPTDPKGQRRKVRTTQRGAFHIDAVPQGTYVLDAYKAAEGASTWSGGRSHPFVPSQRFAMPGDTIRVRGGWETQNVRRIIP